MGKGTSTRPGLTASPTTSVWLRTSDPVGLLRLPTPVPVGWGASWPWMTCSGVSARAW
ncbi:MAG: hypothetical protein HYT80_06905 [Euryarchaeota archaeon]|nr:hypothetical protein [Euryarchaeota archaeon]